ncbi:maleylpyruvate isomerase family mycothiol-dependent enzyme [Sphaerisporangium corydalis]|uniref:Maleylpyruvate isomerase family mycothiol-dependent enzyme n=1 Tax=Sphaerisporangium corydalis TaxID=1441875 RepID=A0ABV9EDC9_9ACTN|nr:maleylpyruvate isomerase family mycothiol-dependent enzyme [Sphaerisporangium corydalis]
MNTSRLLGCLADEFALLRDAVAATDPAATVPSCPEWTVGDLAEHVAYVYLHKTESIRRGVAPDPWPSEKLDSDPVTALADTYARLTATFAAHSPGDHAYTWHEPDQTVGFWIRRMAHETVIHRVDAQLAAGLPVSAIPADIAIDGIDEMLKLFVGYGSTQWADDFGPLLDSPDERPVSVSTSHHAWTLTATKAGVEVSDAATGFGGDALVSGEATPLLLWLYNRAGDETVRLSGDRELLGQFHALRTAGTQ